MFTPDDKKPQAPLTCATDGDVTICRHGDMAPWCRDQEGNTVKCPRPKP